LETGRFPTTTGMFLNDAHLPDGELCLAKIFDAAGYTTGFIGKWHLDGHGRTAYIPPERRQGWEWWRGNECTHDYNHSAYYEGNSPTKKFWAGYDAYAQTRAAQDYIREHAHSDQPFVLMLCYGPPHFPTAIAPKELQAKYPAESIKLPANVSERWRGMALKDAQGYYAHCTALDTCVGEIMKTLDETGLADNTILIFSADHGESLGSHDIKPFLKVAFWNETASVPFLLRYPAVLGKEGRDLQLPITTTDILPTLLGFAGIQIPKSIEGENLSPRLRAGRDDVDRTALYMNVDNGEYRALRSGRYTFVRTLAGPKYLFDNEKDPLQMTNLIDNPDFAAVRADLNQRLTAELTRIKDDFRPGAAYIAEWYPTLKHAPIPYNDEGSTPVLTPKRRP
jgi:arylsulfatase A-like enzyme